MSRDKLHPMIAPIWRQLLAMAAAVIVSVVAFTFIGAPPPSTSQDLAAWVQGIGTIAAVVVAAWAGSLPATLELRQRQEDRRAFVSALSDAVLFVMDSAAGALDAALGHNMPRLAFWLKHLEKTRARLALKKLLTHPPEAWPSLLIYLRLERLDSALQAFADLGGRLELDGPLRANDPMWLEMSEVVEEIVRAHGQLQLALGGVAPARTAGAITSVLNRMMAD